MLDKWMARFEPWSHLALRIAVGLIFLLHGSQKLFGAFGGGGISGTARFLEEVAGITPGTFWAVVVGLVEFLGGLALLLGLLARYAAALLSIVMLVAMLRVHLPKGFFLPDGIEYTLALLGANISLLLSGAGEFALDRYLERLWHPERRPA